MIDTLKKSQSKLQLCALYIPVVECPLTADVCADLA